MFFYKTIATFFGIGFIGKGSGTVAALVFCILLYVGIENFILSQTSLIAFTVITFIAGVFTSSKLETVWGKDSKMIVIDEVLGMSVSLLWLPLNVITLSLGFLLFRIFDISKPLYIKRTENLKGGWGVMVDDLVAGFYTNIVLHLFVYFFPKGYANIY